MCGISLIVSKLDQGISRADISAMNARVKYRGPNGEGYYFGKNFAMGHRRLSIVDLSEAGRQPMQRGDDYIIFNGMIYNYPELRAELISYGHNFSSQTDTEVLLAACQHWGTGAFKKLNGMWAFAWYRANSNEIILCRDHFGIKPLYYTTTGSGLFAVASEVKQFLDLPGFNPVLNKKVAVNFLTKGWLNYSEQTFFKGVKELRGGQYLVYKLSTHDHETHQWYDLAEAAPPRSIGLEEAKMELKNLFLDSLRIRMRADVSIGSCLSGGLDSSTISSSLYANRLTRDTFATVTSCYPDTRFDEQKFSDQVSRQTGFRALKVFPDLNRLLDSGEINKLIYHQDQPFGTASHYSEFQVFKTAADYQLTVMLDGQGADEYLCGYDEFFVRHIHSQLLRGKIKEAFRNIKSRATSRNMSVGAVLKQYIDTLIWFPLIGRMKKIFGRSNYKWLSTSWRKLADQSVLDFDGKNLRDLSLQEMQFSSLPLQLHSEDRNSMMHSIESRLPFLDHRLVEYVISLPCDQKIRNGVSKYVLREAISELPESIRVRADKMGFVAPDEPWIRENHARIRLELEDAVANTEIFSPALLKRFDKFIAGKLQYEPLYFRAVTLNRFMKIFSMQSAVAGSDRRTSSRRTTAQQDFIPALLCTANFLC